MRPNGKILGVLAMVVTAGLAGSCAHDPEDERARCPELVPIRQPPPSGWPSTLAGLHLEGPGPIRTCQTPFALVELGPEDRGCALPPAESPRWIPVPTTRRLAVGRAGQTSPLPPRRATPSDPGFCVFEWTDRQTLPDAPAFARIKAQPDCPLVFALGAGLGSQAGPTVAATVATGPDVAPSFEVPSFVWEPLARTFERQARGMGAARWQKVQQAHVSRPKVPVRVAVVDSTSKGVTAPDRSKHGFAVSRVIGSLFCEDAGSRPCEERVTPHIALPMVDVRRPDYVNGGVFGNFHQLFDALTDVLETWDPRREHLVVNLSLAWSPPPGGVARDALSERLGALLERLSCGGALLVAGAGELASGHGPPLPGSLESMSAPDAARCDALGSPMVRIAGATAKGMPGGAAARPPAPATGYSPLVHAVGAVDARDQRTQVARAFDQPRLAALGLGVVAGGSRSLKYTPPANGTSMSAAIVSGIAAAVWAARPDLEAAEVMALVYEGGVALDGGARSKRARTELCLGEPLGPCQPWKVHRASLCGAISLALPQEKLACATPPDPSSPPPADTLPELPLSLAPPLTSDSQTPEACRLPRCGLATGPDVARIPTGTLPEGGAASCPGCTLSLHFGGSPRALLWGYPATLPPHLRFTIVTVYRASGGAQSYVIPNPTVPRALYTALMEVPDDTYGAVIEWAFALGSYPVVDTTELIVN